MQDASAFHRPRRSAVLLLAVLLLPAAAMCAAGPAEAEWLPLAKGNYWVYRGPTKWVDTASRTIKEETLSWRMEITEVIRHGDSLVAAVVKGMPSDLAWYRPGKERGDYLILRVGSGNYYLFEGDGMQSLLAKMREKTPNLYNITEGGELLLDAPLAFDKRYGDADQLARGWYCWRVQDARAFTGKGIKGLPLASRMVYSVVYRTNPDHQLMGVVPGVGLVSYQYVHHGTTSETDLALTEIHLEKPD